MSKTTLVENLWHQEALFRLILLFPPPMLPRTEPALAPAGQHALLQISEVTHTHSVLTRATQHGLTHKCRQCEPDSALFPLALAAEAAFRNDGITVTWGRIIYHLVLSTKNNKKKKSVEQKANMGGSDTLLPSFIEKSKIKEWLLSQGGSVQMWPPSFVDFLWTRESFIGYSPTFLFTLRPTFWLGWEQLSVFLFAAHQSKTVLMLEAWLQPT